MPYDNLGELRKAIVADAPHFAEIRSVPMHQGADATLWNAVGADGPLDAATPFGYAISDYYLTNPIARASETMAKCSREFVTGPTQMAAE